MRTLLLICLAWQVAMPAWGQRYPTKVIRYIVAASASGGADVLSRTVAEGVGQVLGQQVIVDNRPGAGGNIGAEIAARAPADGYTLFQVSVPQAINATLYRNLAYDVMRDFEAVTQVASAPTVILVTPSLNARSVGDLVGLAKAKPGAINYGSTGVGTVSFLAAELLKIQAGVNIVHVPYRGSGAAVIAVITGETSVYFASVPAAIPQMQQRTLRALAVTSLKRLPLLPDVPTVSESGLPGFEFGNWYGVMLPARTPKEVAAVVREAVISVSKKPEVIKRLNDLGYIIITNQPEEFKAHIRSEIDRFGKVIKALNLTAG